LFVDSTNWRFYVILGQKSLEKFSVTPVGIAFKSFYDAKIASNESSLAIYQSKSDAKVTDDFFQSSKTHWENLRKFINEILPPYLPDSGFIGGERPGEDDFHVAAWLARITATTGGNPDKDGVKALEKELGGPVPTKIANYWNSWSERESWKITYSEGLH
jgi:hypothetical protein